MIEHRQDLFDRALLEQWLGFGKNGYAIWNYRLGLGAPSIEGDKLLEFLSPLKRAPRSTYECYMQTRPYFDSVLPTTHRALLAGVRGWRIEKIMADEQRLKLKKAEKSRGDTYYRTSGAYEFRLANQMALATTISNAAMNNGHRRSDWGVTKPTNGR